MTLDLEETKDQGSFLFVCTLREGRFFIVFLSEPATSWAASFPPASGHATALVALPPPPLRSQNRFSADRSGSGSGCDDIS